MPESPLSLNRFIARPVSSFGSQPLFTLTAEIQSNQVPACPITAWATGSWRNAKSIDKWNHMSYLWTGDSWFKFFALGIEESAGDIRN
jgi:hypothetical protein